jgi:enoyl-CoA hydratase
VPATKVRAQVTDGVLKIDLGGPNEMNILSVGTRKGILEVLRKHEGDDKVLCVQISSLGKVFSAGADLNEIVGLGKREALAYAKFVSSFLGYVEGYPKPTIGLVNGLAVGGGLELLMTLDIVLASPESSFGQTELNVGLVPGGGGSQRLPRMVGVRKAKEMIYTGNLISASEALESGLISRIVEADKLKSEAAEFVQKIRSKSQETLRLVKRAINEGLSVGLDEGLMQETKIYARVLESDETKKRIRNFLEKHRVPRA